MVTGLLIGCLIGAVAASVILFWVGRNFGD
jgi:integral membrane sensor domain MASE1